MRLQTRSKQVQRESDDAYLAHNTAAAKVFIEVGVYLISEGLEQ